MFLVQGLQKLIVFIALSLGLSTASAGSYEDFFDALKADDVTVVRSLLQRGFDPNTVNPQGVPALMMAVLIHPFKWQSCWCDLRKYGWRCAMQKTKVF